MDLSQILKVHENIYEIPIGFVPNMKVPARFYGTDEIFESAKIELGDMTAGQFSSLHQIAHVATMPGISRYSFGMPDMHAGYGFCIGGVAAFDLADPNAVISAGGVGYDINCGVRCFTTDIKLKRFERQKEKLIQELNRLVPSGVGGKKKNVMTLSDVPDIANKGARWAIENGMGFAEDLEVCEEGGFFSDADYSCVSSRAAQRGIGSIGTLGSGNHYLEVQRVETIFDEEAAQIMGLHEDQVVVMIHTGSRGFGYQIASDFLNEMQSNNICSDTPDKQLAGVPFYSELGQKYYNAMKCAANFAWCNRQVITHFARQAFLNIFGESEMPLVYDVAHNIAKVEKHFINDEEKSFIVHRKGATRSFGPGREEVPEKYRQIGQPVLIGGSMGTASYILLGTEGAMQQTFGSTCHGAGRVSSRTRSKRSTNYNKLMKSLNDKGIIALAASKDGLLEEAPDAYKDIEQVIEACHNSGISKKVAKLVPECVIKG